MRIGLRKAYGETLIIGKTYYYVVRTPNGAIGIASTRQFQCVPTTYVTENKENILKFTLKSSIMSIDFASFKHLKLPISIIIPVTKPQSVYILMTAIAPNLIS